VENRRWAAGIEVQDQVEMVGHQAIGKQGALVGFKIVAQALQEEGVVAIFKEDQTSVGATVVDVIGRTRCVAEPASWHIASP
jgi:nucleoside-triphosphatase THEP1